MSMAYIRRYYDGPAKRGGRVEYTDGPPRLGTITGSRDARLLIRLDTEKRSYPFHPTWELRYLDAPAPKGEM
jgi:hypothetical protein